jgi:acetylornithine deacetylase/succinyl-diaminopimelate desuccinylase-like protein
MTLTPRAMMDAVAAARRFARARRDVTVRRLTELLGYPTISAEPSHASDLRACAAWLADLLKRIGLTSVDVCPGRVAPIVTAGWQGSPGHPTVLVYGHYDVQPVEPLSAWATHPFQPARRGAYLHARGASDDKGQLMAQLAAIEACLATSARLPVNLRLVLDGEEEIGSPALMAAVARRWPPLAADVALVSDTAMLAPGNPVLVTGLRGALSARLEIAGPATDLHAGAFGGVVESPAYALARLVASVHDKAGRIAVEDFYDQVRAMTESERADLAAAGPPDRVMLARAGVITGHGEPGFSAFERATRRPAVVVTNLSTSGAGRTVVPEWAAADLSVRLAAGQAPRTTAELLHRHFGARMRRPLRGRLLIRAACPPYTLNPGAPVVGAVRRACRTVYGRDPSLLPSGGSIPFVSTLAAAYGIDVALFGFGLPSDRVHAPNERLYLPNLFRGTDACIELYSQLGARSATLHPGQAGPRRATAGSASWGAAS